jgi:hypothetical protein
VQVQLRTFVALVNSLELLESSLRSKRLKPCSFNGGLKRSVRTVKGKKERVMRVIVE